MRTDMKQEQYKSARIEYAEKLKNPKWQKLRLKVFERDEWSCQMCSDVESTLMVHHLYYENGKEPWDYPIEAFLTLCDSCHKTEHDERPSTEKTLLDTLKIKGFSYSDVLSLATGFRDMNITIPHEVISAAYEFALGDPYMQKIILEEYFKKRVFIKPLLDSRQNHNRPQHGP